jgi:hypothetical protein
MDKKDGGRDQRGKFAKGNGWSSMGGKKRARILPAERRREISKQGYLALVQKHFDGDIVAQGQYLGEVGAWASDQVYPDWMKVFKHPGPPAEFMERRRSQRRALQELSLRDVPEMAF